MNAPAILAEIFGGMFVLVGLSALNRRAMVILVEGMLQNAPLVWVTGFFTFVVGIGSLSFYSAWPSDWHIAITVIAWLILLKGAFITLFPVSSVAFYRRTISTSVLAVAGTIAVILGLALLYLGLTA